MEDFKLTTPVAFIIYNRPNATEQVFQQIRNAKPSKLLLIADGPRPYLPNDADKCAAARAIVKAIDWDCEVFRNFSDKNLGCKQRVSTGLDWVFNMVEEAIILEDDCVPHPTFFRYCQELLERYRNYERIMSIAGSNWQFGQWQTEYSYYFSKIFHPWGWAGWRRSWKYYDVNMKLWPKFRDSKWLFTVTAHGKDAEYWHQAFDLTYKNMTGTWDFQNMFAYQIQNALTVFPNINLVSNIGYGPDATHSKQARGKVVANLPSVAMDFPMRHPPFILPNRAADAFILELISTGLV